jgi:amidase
MINNDELCYRSAVELTALVRRKELSCTEIINGFYDRIEAVNPHVNAICTLIDRELALRQAAALDKRLQTGDSLGALAGLPIAVKDLAETRGIRTTMGSPLYANWVPEFDCLMVERMKSADAIIIGKTNVPEFGAGSHSFNRVFGVTRNPYDLMKSAGGSSGGAAAALAAGMLPLADGSDLGGSLRNPASFCNVVGFRPSPGRVPAWPSETPFDPLSIIGPMARSVDDVSLLISVIAGPDPRAPLAIEQDPNVFAELIDSSNCRDTENFLKGIRVAWSKDLGFLPVHDSVVAVLEQAVSDLTGLGCALREDQPDLKDAEDIFLKLRAAGFAGSYAQALKQSPQMLKDTIRWNTEVGLKLSIVDIAKAEAKRVALYERVLKFFENYDFLILPAAQTPPFPVEWDWVRKINNTKFDNYLQWMQICCTITLTTLPAISVPAGFTADGLPVGLQIVGRPHADLDLLKFARAFESIGQHARLQPRLPAGNLTHEGLPEPFVVSAKSQ